MDMTSIKIQIAKSLNACALCAIAIGFLSSTNVHANDEPTHPTISVTGNAEVPVVPDEAVLTFSIDSRNADLNACLLYTSPSPRDATLSRMPSSA